MENRWRIDGVSTLFLPQFILLFTEKDGNLCKNITCIRRKHFYTSYNINWDINKTLIMTLMALRIEYTLKFLSKLMSQFYAKAQQAKASHVLINVSKAKRN